MFTIIENRNGCIVAADFTIFHTVEDSAEIVEGYGPDSTLAVRYRGQGTSLPGFCGMEEEAARFFLPKVRKAFEEFSKTVPRYRTDGVVIEMVPLCKTQ